MHFLWFQITVEQLNVSTTAIDILFMFDCVLDDEVFAFITEWREFFGQSIEPSVLRRLNTFVSLGIIVESARAVYEFTKLFSGMFRVSPFALKRIYGTIISNIKLTFSLAEVQSNNCHNKNNTYHRGSSLQSRSPH